MAETNLIPDGVRRIFTEGFRVGDVAEPLVSFDESTPSSIVATMMEEARFDAVGVRGGGLVTGVVERADLAESTCGAGARAIEPDVLVLESDSLTKAIRILSTNPRALVTAFGAVNGIITREDVEKPPVRMWLFGMITMVEMRYTLLINQHLPNETWRPFVSEGRAKKAEELLVERRRRHQSVSLLDCLQLSDKGQIIARNEDLRRLTIFESRSQAEEGIKLIEGLRNNLAHAQDIASTNWAAIERLSHYIELFLN